MKSMSYNLYAQFHAAFGSHLSDTAIETDDDRRWTFGDLHGQSAQMANWLQSLGLKPGDRVMVQVEKSVPALVFYLACLRAGVVYVPLNTAYQSAELAYFMENAEPSVFVADPSKADSLRELTTRIGVPHLVTLGADGQGSLIEATRQLPTEHAIFEATQNDLAAILYTSGTTGRSKGAQLTHNNLASNALTLHKLWGWKPGDVLVHALPIFHVHGLFVACHCALLNASKMLWMGKFTPRQMLAWLPQATVFMGVPTLYVRLLQEAALTPESCAHMRLFISGSAPLLTETFREWQDRTGHTILERYGMSETAMITSNPYRAEDGPRLGGTVGRPLPGVELRCMSEQGQPCPTGDIGGIEVRGPNVFPGYWRMPEANAKEFTADGWFKTGDVGHINAEGYVTIVGRSKDLIITGGYNVYPAEVEGYINDLPGVAESAVIGCPHADFGEGVVAVVVAQAGAKLDAAELTQAIKSQIAGFKVPKHLFIVDELPRNVMGKVQKKALRETYAKVFAN
ncbi:malonyl-CoA synthase [Hydrogenophaga crassostreae]|uniref:Malonyl-CoA synthase n=1 Tax=Hydrogenophaga crassostreae TaxID=1763535 RepID=A0A167H3S5_9BURK|nr:malonyl-CoA synthase [Hydrogenophaga crassostreae]AOW13036.1 malonyl-CoA synthase [Hydrogenophaga crassostreae]OAD40220.1 malonyl-CoA synthase [Hydrogenophaga crassostreae]